MEVYLTQCELHAIKFNIMTFEKKVLNSFLFATKATCFTTMTIPSC